MPSALATQVFKTQAMVVTRMTWLLSLPVNAHVHASALTITVSVLGDGFRQRAAETTSKLRSMSS